MRKVLSFVIIGIVVLSGLHAAAFSPHDALTTPTQRTDASTSVRFPSPPTMSETDGFVELHLDGSTTVLLESTRPVLPVYVKTYQIPFGSTNIQVTCTEQDITTLQLTQEVLPARIAPLSTLGKQPVYEKDPMVYGSAAFYPASWFSYDLGAGRNEQETQVTFVKVVCYPVRYSPQTNTLEYTAGFDIQLTYDPPAPPLQSAAEDYDLVIIAPEKFSAPIQSLVEFKNGKGIQTKFKSVEAILGEYDGYDPPEQIKYFIKNEYDTAHITYVLFVGGIKSHLYSKDKDTRSAGWTGWHVP
ncbi:MAG: C25 family cysteine peptidase, partial [Candidatus Thermoplasmatota archaeon]